MSDIMDCCMTCDEIEALDIRNEYLSDENEDLRELVKDMYRYLFDCGECVDQYEPRMQELGIEVNE